MYSNSILKRRPAGFTLIEALIFLFLFALITLVFFQTFAYGTKLIQQSKFRLGAIALGNQKMEIIRSLDYATIGTVAGVPAGDIAQDEDVQINNASYHVHTFIRYVDDPYDGVLGGSPNDLVPNDFKYARVEVSWGSATEAEKIQLFSTFAPPGVEQPAGGGILSVNILDSHGAGVSGATVHITNSSVAPAIDVTTTTDGSGNLFLVSAPASVQGYHITFSKGGYFGSATYAPYPTSTFIPVDVHASVVNATINQVTFVMDRSSTLQLRTIDPFGTAIPSISYQIDGGRRLGSAFGTGAPVYDFSANSSTNASGEKEYAGRSYGSYTWTLGGGVVTHAFVGLVPESTAGINNIELAPNTSQTVDMVLADKSVNGALITVTNATDGTPVAGASVKLSNAGLGYDETVVATQYGKAYFPRTASPGMVAGTYDLQISAPGFTSASDTVDITSGLATKSKSLSP